MSLHLGICIDVGEAWDLKWCPLGGSEKGEDGMEVEEEEGRLGLLAGAFTDGSISFFVVPNPEALRAEQKTEEGETLYGE
jgi:transcription factor C subunit 6